MVSLYESENSTQPVWRDAFTTSITSGYFNIDLGSQLRLPDPLIMEKVRWVGVSLNGGRELTPRSRLAVSPLAMTVVDSSLGRSKLSFPTVSDVTVDGRSILTSEGSVNLISGEGIKLTYDEPSKSVVIKSSLGQGHGSSGRNSTLALDWNQAGNSVTGVLGTDASTSGTGSNWEAIVDANVIYRFHQNNNLIGGYSGNTIPSATRSNNVISGGGSSGIINEIENSDYSIIGGGGANTINNQTGTLDSTHSYQTISGGRLNETRRNYSTVGGGNNNESFGMSATIGGARTMKLMLHILR